MLSNNNILIVEQNLDIPRLIYFGKVLETRIKVSTGSNEITSDQYQEVPFHIESDLISNTKMVLFFSSAVVSNNIYPRYESDIRLVLLDNNGIVHYQDSNVVTIIPFTEPVVKIYKYNCGIFAIGASKTCYFYLSISSDVKVISYNVDAYIEFINILLVLSDGDIFYIFINDISRMSKNPTDACRRSAIIQHPDSNTKFKSIHCTYNDVYAIDTNNRLHYFDHYNGGMSFKAITFDKHQIQISYFYAFHNIGHRMYSSRKDIVIYSNCIIIDENYDVYFASQNNYWRDKKMHTEKITQFWPDDTTVVDIMQTRESLLFVLSNGQIYRHIEDHTFASLQYFIDNPLMNNIRYKKTKRSI